MNSEQFLSTAESTEPESCSRSVTKMTLRAREVAQELGPKFNPIATAYIIPLLRKLTLPSGFCRQLHSLHKPITYTHIYT